MNSFFLFFSSSVRMSLGQLLRHKVRSFLTMLGILIGVGAVVAIVSLGEGLRDMFNSQIACQGSGDLIYIMPDAPMLVGRVPRGIKLFENHDLDMVAGSEYVEDAR